MASIDLAKYGLTQADITPAFLKGLMLSKDRQAFQSVMSDQEKADFLAQTQKLVSEGKNIGPLISEVFRVDNGTVRPASWWERNAGKVITAAALVGGGIVAGGGLAGGAATPIADLGTQTGTAATTTAGVSGAAPTVAGTAAAPAATLPSTAVGPLAPMVSAAPQITASSVPSAVTSTAPSLWSKIAGPLISTAVPAVAGVIGTKMQVDASKQAADAQAKAAQEALDWQKQQYAIRQQQLAPTIGVGNASRTRLGELMGIAAPDGGWQAPAATQVPLPTSVPPAGQTASSATATPNSAIATPQMVTMRAPTGQVSQVPADQVAHYQQQGAQVVPAGLPAH